MRDFLAKLQEKPYETRVKILWGTVVAAAVVLVAIWALSLKTTLSKIDGANLITVNNPTAKETKEVYASVEWIERTGAVLKIYFNFNNTTDDILNISKLADITLVAKEENLKAQRITDRQGKEFVQKILSNTQNFGILTFALTNESEATLQFDQMFLEKSSSNVFMQKLELNLDELSKKNKVRN